MIDIKQLPAATSAGLPISLLAELGRGLLFRAEQSKICPDSPLETVLGALLNWCLRSEIEAGRIRLHQRERLVLPGDEALEVEVDILIHQTTTNAQAIIEIHSFEFHRRDPDAFEQEIRRERSLRRWFPNYEIYSGREVSRDPWGVTAEILGLFQTQWRGFEPIEWIENTSIAECTAARVPSGKAAMVGAVDSHSRPPMPLMERLRQTAASLPRGPEPSDAGLRLLRARYPRAYEEWDFTEFCLVVEAFRARYDVTEIASAIQRKPSAVWRRLRKEQIVSEKR